MVVHPQGSELHTRVAGITVLKYNCPKVPLTTSPSAYARVLGGGLNIEMRMLGGVGATVCVGPVIEMLCTVKHAAVASGQTVKSHVLPAGVIEVLEGMLTE